MSMLVTHGRHTHDVQLLDDGTLDTVIDVDGHQFRFSEAERTVNGFVKQSWLTEMAIEVCDGDQLGEPEP